MNTNLLTTHELLRLSYEETKHASQRVGVICCGDSLTGYANAGAVNEWPTPCYPQFLADLLVEAGYRKIVACYGYPGETSEGGIEIVSRCLDMFTHATFVVIGFGTNDMVQDLSTKAPIKETLGNIDVMTRAVMNARKIPILLGTYGIEMESVDKLLFEPRLSEFNSSLCNLARQRLKFLNEALGTYAAKREIALVDVAAAFKADTVPDGAASFEDVARRIADAVFAKIQHFQSLIRNKTG